MQVMGKGGLLLRDTDTQCSNVHQVTFFFVLSMFVSRSEDDMWKKQQDLEDPSAKKHLQPLRLKRSWLL